jgi:AAA+ ATPase superfamily predicted ATPase
LTTRFNPYVIGAPVKDTNFYGREKLINIVRDTLAISTVNLLVFFGQRRIGKTSLLQNLENQAALKDFVFIYNDATELFDKSSYEVLYHFVQKIAQALGLRAPAKAQLKRDESLFRKDFLPQAYEKIHNRRLVLTLDEFDIFERRRKAGTAKDKSNGTGSALDVIEHLLESEPALAFIVSLGRGREKLQSRLSHITRIGHWAKVSLLEEEDARRLIVEPALNQLAYLPEAVDTILELTAGHPYYTQLICYEIFNELQFEGGNQVQVSDVEKAAEKALETGTGGFGWIWEGLAPAERMVSSLIAEAAQDSPNHIITEAQLSAAFEENHIHQRGLELTEALNQLIDLDVIERKGPIRYRYLVEIVRRWIHKKHPVSHEREENLPLLSTRAADEFAKGQSASTLSTAISHYQEAIAANPNHIAAQLALADALFEQDQVEESVEAYEAAHWLDPAKAKEGLEKAKAKARQISAQERPGLSGFTPLWISGGVLLIAVLIGFFIWGGLPAQDRSTPILTQEIAVKDYTPTIQLGPTPKLTENPTQEPATRPTELPTEELTQEPTAKPTIIPTEEPTQEPTTGPTMAPTEVPTQTPTTEPTTMPTQVPPSTASPTVTLSGPSPTPTPGYNAPILVRPEAEARIPADEEVSLEWNPVGTLAENERYAIRLIFVENGKRQWDGHQVRSTSWVVPRDLLYRVDGPEFKFEWFVFVERVDENGQPFQISPNSETRVFYWWR